MRNWNRYFLALGALSAISCWNVGVASFGEALGASATFAVAQEDPFADDWGDELDPFGSAATDDETERETDAAELNGSDDPFGASSTTGPFAPSSLDALGAENANAAPFNANDSAAATSVGAATGPEGKKDVRPEDVPDEEKTEADFYKTLTPFEKSILRVPPETASEYLVAAVRISRVGRPAFAKLLVEKALEAPDGTPEECAIALDSLGSGRAIYFVANPVIGPAGSQAVDKVTNIARQYWESEAYLRDAISRLNIGTESDRAQALLDVRKGGVAAIVALIGDLRSGDATAKETAKSLLKFFDKDGVDALLATLRGASETELAPIADALAATVDSRIGLELERRYYLGIADPNAKKAVENALIAQFGALPTRADAVRETAKRADEYFKRSILFAIVLENETTTWTWDAADDAPTQTTRKIEAAYRAETAEWAQAVLKIEDAENPAPSWIRNLAVVATAERILYDVGLDSGADGLAAFDSELPNLTAEQLVDAIAFALETNRFKGAIIPTILLQSRGDATLCYSADGGPSVVVRAAICPDRRLRFEALTAIVGWNPDQYYWGVGRVAAALEWFATSTGERVAVVAAPKFDEAGRIGANLSQQGFKIVPVSTGRDALIKAQVSADVELVVATAAVRTPDLRVVAQALRSDVRTRDVPLLVGYVSGPDDEIYSVGALIGSEPNALALPTPFDLESSAWAVQKLFDSVQPEQVAADLRLQHSKAAARALLKLVATRPDLYFETIDLNATIARFLATPSLFDEGLEFAATTKTPFAQRVLVDMIGDLRFDAPTRRKALTALQRQWSANGSLLRGPEIVAMYDRYNASEKEDAETQQILSAALDAFEKTTEKEN